MLSERMREVVEILKDPNNYIRWWAGSNKPTLYYGRTSCYIHPTTFHALDEAGIIVPCQSDKCFVLDREAAAKAMKGEKG